MNTQSPVPEASAPLPELSAQRIDEMEDALFSDIARERARGSARRARRGRLWPPGLSTLGASFARLRRLMK